MGGGPSRGRYRENGISKYISGARGIEKAEEVRTFPVSDEEGNICAVVKTYKWSHDGPFQKEDYEPVIYFYEKGEQKPKHAIAFSHYGHVYYKNLKSWNSHDYSPRFPNQFHTPILNADKVEIKNGLLSKGAYACAKAALYMAEQRKVEPTKKMIRPPPKSAEISQEVNKIVKNPEVYRDEIERL